MTKEAQKVMDELYEAYQQGNRMLGYKFSGIPYEERKRIVDTIEYLEEKDLVYTVKSLGGIQFKLNANGIDYMEEMKSPPSQSPSPSIEYHIGTIQGSAIIGSQRTAVINSGSSLGDIFQLIASKEESDHYKLYDLFQHLEAAEETSEPLKKGFLGKFSDTLAKHSDIALAVGGWLVNFFTKA